MGFIIFLTSLVVIALKQGFLTALACYGIVFGSNLIRDVNDVQRKEEAINEPVESSKKSTK
jgi:hypothetical protein